ncbi:hypothetical protein V8B97DRAFT_2026028 [Scleroderma yunnanense]
MAALQCAFKQYVLCHAHSEFRLHLEPGNAGSNIEHYFNYLHDLHCPKHELFLSPFFWNFMINMLFVTSMDLWQYVEGNSLDFLFRLAGAAIAAMLRDFSQGYHYELDSSAGRWDNPVRKDWLDSLQKTIMVQGQAGFPPTISFNC